MELTKEEQIQAIYDLKVGYTLGHADIAMLKAMARQMLAWMEQEPVAWKHRLVELSTGQSDHWKLTSRKTESTQGDRFRVEVIPLYAAPQLPQPAAVDDDKFRADFERWMVEDEKCIVGSSDPYPAGIESRNWRVWNACRAVMLKHSAPFIVTSDHRMMEMPQVEDINALAAMLQGAELISQLYTSRDGWVAVPVEMTPEQMRAVQLNSELGAYAAANLTGAYSLFREFWDVAVKSVPNQEVK